MRILLIALAVSGAIFWLYIVCRFAANVAGKVRQARTLTGAEAAAQSESAAAQARAHESLDRANADLAGQLAARDREAAEQRELIARAFADADVAAAKLAEIAADAAASLDK